MPEDSGNIIILAFTTYLVAFQSSLIIATPVTTSLTTASTVVLGMAPLLIQESSQMFLNRYRLATTLTFEAIS